MTLSFVSAEAYRVQLAFGAACALQRYAIQLHITDACAFQPFCWILKRYSSNQELLGVLTADCLSSSLETLLKLSLRAHRMSVMAISRTICLGQPTARLQLFHTLIDFNAIFSMMRQDLLVGAFGSPGFTGDLLSADLMREDGNAARI